jgi:hypothetical protein
MPRPAVVATAEAISPKQLMRGLIPPVGALGLRTFSHWRPQCRDAEGISPLLAHHVPSPTSRRPGSRGEEKGMKCGSRMAVAIVGGYLLGRSQKTRLAAVMALLAAGGKLPVDPGDLLRRTPLGAVGGPLDKFSGDLGTQLVDAGKSVVMAAASNRIDSLSDRLQERADRLRTPDVKAGGKGRSRGESRDEEPRRGESRRGRPEPEEDEYDEYDEDEYEDEYEDEPEPEEPVARKAPRRSAPTPRQEARRRVSRGDEALPRQRARSPRARAGR